MAISVIPKAPTVDCPEGCGRMTAEACSYEGGSTYDVPSGPAWHLTCPGCGWEAWVDLNGLPFWKKGRLRMWKRGDPVVGTREEDVHPDSHPEAARRINALKQLCSARAALRTRLNRYLRDPDEEDAA